MAHVFGGYMARMACMWLIFIFIFFTLLFYFYLYFISCMRKRADIFLEWGSPESWRKESGGFFFLVGERKISFWKKNRDRIKEKMGGFWKKVLVVGIEEEEKKGRIFYCLRWEEKERVSKGFWRIWEKNHSWKKWIESKLPGMLLVIIIIIFLYSRLHSTLYSLAIFDNYCCCLVWTLRATVWFVETDLLAYLCYFSLPFNVFSSIWI